MGNMNARDYRQHMANKQKAKSISGNPVVTEGGGVGIRFGIGFVSLSLSYNPHPTYFSKKPSDVLTPFFQNVKTQRTGRDTPVEHF